MNYLYAVIDGIIIAGIFGLVSRRKPDQRDPAMFFCILLNTIRIWLLYRGQENSDFFFWHPYISFTIMNLSEWLSLKKHRSDFLAWCKERLLLWQIVIIPVISGFELAVGWLMKLYIR